MKQWNHVCAYFSLPLTVRVHTPQRLVMRSSDSVRKRSVHIASSSLSCSRAILDMWLFATHSRAAHRARDRDARR